MRELLLRKWESLTPKNKQMIVLATAILVFIGIAALGSGGQSSAPVAVVNDPTTSKKPKGIFLDPDGAQLTISELQNQVVQLQHDRTQLENALEQQRANTSALQQSLADSQTLLTEQLAGLIASRGQDQTNLSSLRTDLVHQVSTLEQKMGQGIGVTAPPTKSNTSAPLFQNTPSTATKPVVPATMANSNNGTGNQEDKSAILDFSEQAQLNPEALHKEAPITDTRWYLQTGAIFEGVLLTGMDAPTNAGARGDTTLSLLRLQKEAILPNYWKFDIRECFALIEGFGDLASERAMLRGKTLSCIDSKGRVMETALPGYAVGEDGKVGIRGVLVSKQGQLIGRAMMAGFIDGIAKIFQPAPGSIRSLSDINQANLGAIAEGSVIGGAGSAMEEVAKFYIEMAKQIFPVIEIDAGRKVQFILSAGTTLTFRAKNSSLATAQTVELLEN